VAGKREGLGGERSGLFYEMIRIADELRPMFLVWENVPGLLSSDNGRDFARVLMALDSIGYCGAWSSLDSQFFGVAQRRRRVFGVFTRLDIGARGCAEILSFASRGGGDTTAGRKAGQVTPALPASGAGTSRTGNERTEVEMRVVPTITADYADKWGLNDQHIDGGAGLFVYRKRAGVRRLTPTECERLQGFPDGWTEGEGQSDSQRYRQVGNAVTVSVAEWIGRRIVESK